MPWPNNNVADIMEGEAVSNGGWISAISTVFPCPQYLLAPELRMAPRRFDFAVVDVGKKAAFFAFEGKGTDYNWNTLAAEVLQCCQAIRPRGYQGYTYGMGGSGPECIIIEWDGGAQVQYLYIDGQGQLARREDLQTLHITNNQAVITYILQEIRNIHY